MCSGSSGQFEDDEEPEQGDSDLVDRESEAFWRCAGGGSRSWEGQPELALRPVPDVDDYEVLVGAERIIEWRTIRANPCVFSLLGAFECAEPWEEGPRGFKQLRPETANTYQTLRPFESCFSGSDDSARNTLIWRWLLVVVAAALALGLAAR